MRKTKKAILLAQNKARWKSHRKGRKIQKSTLEYAKYFMVFTTFPEEEFNCKEILEWYRIRWQIELVFKRFKSIAQLGHIPKRDDESTQAWLYGKLFVVLLLQKLIAHAHQPQAKKSSSQKYRPRSNYREFSFMLHQMQRAIEPDLSLKNTMNFWEEISETLSEPSRKRKYQLENFDFKRKKRNP